MGRGAPGVAALGLHGEFVAVAANEPGLHAVAREPFDGAHAVELPFVALRDRTDAAQITATFLGSVRREQDVADVARWRRPKRATDCQQHGDRQRVVADPRTQQLSACAADRDFGVREDGIEVCSRQNPTARRIASTDGDHVAHPITRQRVPTTDLGEARLDVLGTSLFLEGGRRDFCDADRLVESRAHRGFEMRLEFGRHTSFS